MTPTSSQSSKCNAMWLKMKRYRRFLKDPFVLIDNNAKTLTIWHSPECIIKLKITLLQPNQIGMTWQYTIEWHDTGANRKSIVVVTSKPRSQSEASLISIKAWTSALFEDDPAKIVLYAQVLRGDSPVIGAKVMASVVLESTNNGSVVTLSPVRLHDNGYGGKKS